MHDSVMWWADEVLKPEHIKGKDVCEAGAYNVNGSLRPWILSHAPTSYTGIDIRPGPGVDHVCSAAQLGKSFCDLMVSTEMLEHAERWRDDLTGLANAVRPGGLVLLTTRSPGFGHHDHPGDYWRFTCPQLAEIFVYDLHFDLLEVRPDPQCPGVFLLARRVLSGHHEVNRAHQALPAPPPGNVVM